ncbi:MAG: phosphoenolpyruvate--protein phosphotransferase [Deferribacterales bacterium]|nr:phosphoenolpyruvate--protein phosphotransferase [Deferribacterales bacterium]
MIIKKGIAVSSGIAIGKCCLVDRNKVFVTGYTVSDVESEIDKLKEAVNYTSGVIDRLQYSNIVGKINKELYDAYKLLLEDELFIGEAVSIIKKEKVNAEFALKKVRDNFIDTMMASDNEYMRGRAYDIEHIYQRIQRHMSNIKYDEFDEADSDSLIISHDLAASDIEVIIKKGIKGFATDIGSKTSHNAIMAKSAGLVSVMGLADIYDSVSNGITVIIDGFLGQVIVEPDEKTLSIYKKKMDEYNKFLSSFNKVKDRNCFSKDGVQIHLSANIENNAEITLLDVYGLKGVGLYRTEFLYLNNSVMKDEEPQYKAYSEAVSMLRGKQLTLRSFDLGGDKISRYMPFPDENNPAMGLRAIRFCLKHENFFRTQLRAVLRAAAEGDIRLLIPMVSSVDELINVKDIIDSECNKLKNDNIPYNSVKIGVMIELPSAAMSIDKFVPYADFFSVGTNDLIQYLLGVDRNNENVNHIYSPAHFSVISILKHLYMRAKVAGKEISICGEIAGDCRYISMLIGIGYRSFSMSPRASYMVRKVISMLDTSECSSLVEDMLAAPSVKDAEKILTIFNNNKVNNIYL